MTKVNPTFLQRMKPAQGSPVSIESVIDTFVKNLQFILKDKFKLILARDQAVQTDFKENKETQTDGFD